MAEQWTPNRIGADLAACFGFFTRLPAGRFGFGEVNFAERATGYVYLRVGTGRVEWVDAQVLEKTLEPASHRALAGILPGIESADAPAARTFLPDEEAVHTVGTWKLQ